MMKKVIAMTVAMGAWAAAAHGQGNGAASGGAATGTVQPSSLSETFTVDERHTFPSFEISHLGFSTQRGRFNRTHGKIILNSRARSGSIHVAIDANSIDTGLAALEERLQKADFFNTEKYPAITYDSDKIVFEGQKPVRAEGRLTLLGVTKPVTLDIKSFQCGVHPITKKNVCGADAATRIKRSDFGMTAFLPVIGDEVKIQIQVEGFKI